MKIKKIALFTVLTSLIFSFISCASTNVKEDNPNFLADMDAFNIGEIVALNKQNFFKPKPVNVSVDFFPRTSSVGMSLKDGMNKVYLIFSPEEFQALSESVDKYLEIKESNGFVKGYKPGRKNRFYKGEVDILWGAAGLGREVMTKYDTNYEWMEDNPYFRLEVSPANAPDEDHVSSPTVSIYFTPAQATALKSVINMEDIMKEIEDFNSAAYDFD